MLLVPTVNFLFTTTPDTRAGNKTHRIPRPSTKASGSLAEREQGRSWDLFTIMGGDNSARYWPSKGLVDGQAALHAVGLQAHG
ncbi:MAG: hypothetical protein U0176_23055 [Bacteroidia bacterium]